MRMLKLLLMQLCWHAAADLDWTLITLKLMRHDDNPQLHWQLLQLLLCINTRRPILLQHANSRPSALQASLNIGTLQESFVRYWVIQFHSILICLTPLLTQDGSMTQHGSMMQSVGIRQRHAMRIKHITKMRCNLVCTLQE